MPKILKPKDVTGTTRFNLDFQLSKSVKIQLIKEFKKDYPVLKETPASIKLINSNYTNGIEIGDKFISFFPELLKGQKEKIRERIYKHIAKKSEVYYSTSKESLELSISSLLADDIRSCASLLYYALHKYINGSMYSFFNNQLMLEDHKVELAEVDHFTSANFYSFSKVYNNATTDIAVENYKKKICTKNKSANPFLLTKYIIKGDLKELEVYLLPYINYISYNLFNKQYDDKHFAKHLNQLIKGFFSKKNAGDKVSQEEEVKASIAFSIEKSLVEEEDKSLWMLYILALRLYWLRQTADYEFDFEVKTSIREMSILLSAVKSFLDIQLQNEESKQLEDSKAGLGEEFKSKEKSLEQDFKEKADQDEIKDNKMYSVDIKFPSEIHIDHEVSIFLTALHLDSFFKKEEIIRVLNFTEHITNEGKYFIFESAVLLAPQLYIYITEDGRWTAWFKMDEFAAFVKFSDLIGVFQEFLNLLKQGYKKAFENEFSPRLIYSIPLYVTKSKNLLDANSIVKMDEAMQKQTKDILRLFVNRLGYNLKTPRNSFSIKIKDLIVEFKLIFNPNRFTDIVPFGTMFVNKVVKNPKNKVFISLVVSNDEEESIKKMMRISSNAYIDLIKDFKMDNALEGFTSLNVTSYELEEFINNKDKRDSRLLHSIVSIINQVAYNKIMMGQIEGVYEIIEKCIGFPEVAPYAVANKALFYLRNESLNIDECEEKGKELYKHAMDIEHDSKGEYIENLEQKYNYEMARFYFKRKVNYQKVEEYLQKAISFGEEGHYYKDSIKLHTEFLNVITLMETASDVSLSYSEETTGKLGEKKNSECPFPKETKLVGTGEITIITSEGNLDNENLPVMYVNEDTLVMEFTMNLVGFEKGEAVYIYMDKIFEKTEQSLDLTQTTITLKKEMLKLGVHTVTAVQFKDNNPLGKILSFIEMNFEIKERK
ncbi:hypothetical protein B4117_1817 [Bacillus mycoides]|uniref:hypothetical protein n=1 Tax=Bacillus mycoides TaxID=1405 RepID=UPI0007AB36FD|nr:hypothetical protein [Bacillus mycoides]KZE06656.1 hypothetical protein B4117_1817 [Bacillus mycoides]